MSIIRMPKSSGIDIDGVASLFGFHASLQAHGRRFFYSDKSAEETAAKVKDFLKAGIKDIYSADPDKVAVIDRQWEVILNQACENIGEDSSELNNFLLFEKIRKISTELTDIIVAIEPRGLFPWETSAPKENEHVRNVLKYLLHDIALFGDVCNYELLNKLTCTSDADMTAELKKELQELLWNFYDYARTTPGSKDNFVLEMMIGQVIALIAFLSCYKEGETIEIPVKIDGKWRCVEYKTGLISLNPAWMGEEIQAVTWLAVKEDAPPLLVYKGSRGVVSWFSDFTPGYGVGEWLFERARPKIDEFFLSLAGTSHARHRVHVYGISLGSALAYRTAQAHADHVHVHAYAPPGIDRIVELPKVRGDSFIDPNDPVSLAGQMPDGDHHRLIRVIRPNTTCFPLTHARVYGGEETLLLRVNAAYENARTARQVVNFLRDLFAYPIALLLGTVILLNGAYYYITQLFRNCIACLCSTQEAQHEEIEIQT